MMNAEWIDYFAVLLLGAMIGFVEILARYKDAPFKVAFSPPQVCFIFLSMQAYRGWRFGACGCLALSLAATPTGRKKRFAGCKSAFRVSRR